MKREITWNDEVWILDYSTNTIYQDVIIYDRDDPNYIPVNSRIGDYPFREVKDAIYFCANNEFYKVEKDQAIKISKEEYDEIKNYRRISENDRNDVKFIASYVNSIIIDELFKQKYNLKISTRVENSIMVPMITHRYPNSLRTRIESMSRGAMLNLPRYIDKRDIKKKLKEKLIDNSKGYLDEMIEQIYENQKQFLNQIAADIKVQIEERKQRVNEGSKSK